MIRIFNGSASAAFKVADQSLHFFHLTALTFDDIIITRTRESLMFVRSLVRIAIEWCGIIAFMYETSSTVIWLRTSHNATPKMQTLACKMAAFARQFS
ncbi:MAG: hypothetical protein H0V76_09435 [Blastocatellia bacterium]|nr:hypothetical protein [Blastocatellia bacterium]